MKKNNTPQIHSVRKYFDSIASLYAKRYVRKKGYHAYLFNERIRAATSGLQFEGKSVLDIGAGTGGLYDYLDENHSNFQYLGIDASSEMLHQSKIPTDAQIHGEAISIEFGARKFDFIYMLGVTTYLSQEDLIEHVKLCKQILTEKGRLVVSFTHRYSIDSLTRAILGPLFKYLVPGKGVLQQTFPTSKFSKSEAISSFSSFMPDKIHWQNQTLTPINHLLPNASVSLAKILLKYLPSFILPLLSADFLVVFKFKNETHTAG